MNTRQLSSNVVGLWVGRMSWFHELQFCCDRVEVGAVNEQPAPATDVALRGQWPARH
jgi:hypothetical protein